MSAAIRGPHSKRTLKDVRNLHTRNTAETIVPSVLHLALAMTEDDARCGRLNDAKDALADVPANMSRRRELDAADFFLSDRKNAMSELARSIPAKTLGDAAAHIVMAYLAEQDLLHNDNDVYRRGLLHRQIRRCLVSALRVVAEAANLPIESIGGNWMVEAFAREFPDAGEQV